MENKISLHLSFKRDLTVDHQWCLDFPLRTLSSSHESNISVSLMKHARKIKANVASMLSAPKEPCFPACLRLTHNPHSKWLEKWDLEKWVSRHPKPTCYFLCELGHSSLDKSCVGHCSLKYIWSKSQSFLQRIQAY